MKKLYALLFVLASVGLIYGASTFSPSTSLRGLLVDQNGAPYSIGTAGAAGSFNPSNSARVQLVDENGQAYKATSGGGGGSGTVTSIGTTAPILGGTITTTGTITCRTATGSVSGCLSAADWTTFNAKGAGSVTSIATTAPITGGVITGTGTVACATCTTSATSLTLNQLLFGAGLQGMAVGDLTGDVTTSGGKATTLGASFKIRAISFTLGDPQGSALATTATDYMTVPFACTISAYNLLVDATDTTLRVKFWKVATGTAIPTVSNSISTSGLGVPSGTAIHSTTTSDFTTTTVSANDIIAMNVSTANTAKYVNAVLQCNQ